MRYGLLLLAAVMGAGCAIFGDGECDPVTGDCSAVSFCCTPLLTLQCTVFSPGTRTINLVLQPAGGSRPYAYAVNWGHGDEERALQAGPGATTLGHTFPEPTETRSYSVQVTVTDRLDATAACTMSHSIDGPTAPGGG